MLPPGRRFPQPKRGSFPAASKSCITFEVRQDTSGFSVLLNGQYIGQHSHKESVEALTSVLPGTGNVRDLRSFSHCSDPKFHPLSMSSIAKPGVMRNAAVSLEPGLQTVNGVPLVLFHSLTLDSAPALEQQRDDRLCLATQDPSTLGRGYPELRGGQAELPVPGLHWPGGGLRTSRQSSVAMAPATHMRDRDH